MPVSEMSLKISNFKLPAGVPGGGVSVNGGTDLGTLQLNQ